MNNAGMAALRQDAYSLLERVPDDKLFTVVQFMRDMADNSARERKEQDLQERRAAFKRLQELIESIPPMPDLDPEKELAEWREEKFGNAGAD